MADTPSKSSSAFESGEIQFLLERILASSQFASAHRMQRFLRYVVENSEHGDLGRLKETVIGVEVFDRTPGYDPKVDAIVRVEARRLRSKLEQYYSQAGVDEPIHMSLPVGSYGMEFRRRPAELPPDIPGLPPRPLVAQLTSGMGKAPAIPWRMGANWRPRTLLVAGMILVGAWWVWQRGTSSHEPALRRITADDGLSTDPALSPDGRFLIYASDRGGEQNLSLWRIDVAGGEPTRLTSEPYDDREPAIHPNGHKIAFRSERDGGGVYTLALEGGLPTLIAKDGRRPRYSPDGAWILYWVRDERYSPSRAFVVPSDGGEPRQIGADFADVHNPIWSPAGKAILFCGTRAAGVAGEEHDWWVLPFPSGEAVKTGAVDAFASHAGELNGALYSRSDRAGVPHAWVGNQVIFSASLGDSNTLWQVPIDAGWKVNTKPKRLTFGTSTDTGATAAASTVAFSSGSTGVHVWSATLDPETGRAAGELQRMTWQPGIEMQPSLSPEGKTLAYVAERGKAERVYLRNIDGGKEMPLAGGDAIQDFPHFSPDGQSIALRSIAGGHTAIETYHLDGTGRRKICADCGSPYSWSPDGQWLLFEPDAVLPYIGLLNVRTQERSVALQRGDWGLRAARFSPDAGWIVFQADTSRMARRVYAVRYRPGMAAPSAADWVEISEGASNDYLPLWSDDGKIIYFISDREGRRSIWGRRFNEAERKPVGEAFEVLALRSARRTLVRNFQAKLERAGLCITAGRITFALDEANANIWLTELPAR